MNRRQMSYRSADQLTDIQATTWEVDEPKALLQLTHGMLEFIDRYDGFAKFLNEHGILVFGHDKLGHGGSVIDKEHWGFFSESNGDEILIEDIYWLTSEMKQRFPYIPLFLLGHSMGSFETRRMIETHPELFQGAIIVGTGGESSLLLKSGIHLAKWIRQFKGPMYRSDLLHNLSVGGYFKQIENARSKSSWLSHDEDIIRAYDEDERCNFIFTTSAFIDLFHLILSVQDSNRLESIPKEFPILILSGAEDPVGKNGKAPINLWKRYREAGLKNVSITLYDKMYHEILNEVVKEEVYEDILSFILRNV